MTPKYVTDNLDRYIPGGMSKFGAFTIENIAGESTLQYRLFINGEETWSTLIAQPPVVASSKANSFLGKLGLF